MRFFRTGAADGHRSEGVGPVDTRDWSDETIAPPRYGLDAASFGAVGVNYPAQRRYLHDQVVLFYRHVRPHSAHEFVAGDQITVALEQDRKYVQRTRPEWKGAPDAAIVPPRQPAAAPIEAEAFKLECVGCGERIQVTVRLWWAGAVPKGYPEPGRTCTCRRTLSISN